MVGDAKTAAVRERAFWSALTMLAALAAPAAGAPTPLRLEQVSARVPPDFSPAHAGKTVVVKGLVSSRALSFLNYQQIPIQEGRAGLVLEGPESSFDKLTPGDEIEAIGKVSSRAGMVILQTTEFRILFHGAAPAPEGVA